MVTFCVYVLEKVGVKGNIGDLGHTVSAQEYRSSPTNKGCGMKRQMNFRTGVIMGLEFGNQEQQRLCWDAGETVLGAALQFHHRDEGCMVKGHTGVHVP